MYEVNILTNSSSDLNVDDYAEGGEAVSACPHSLHVKLQERVETVRVPFLKLAEAPESVVIVGLKYTG